MGTQNNNAHAETIEINNVRWSYSYYHDWDTNNGYTVSNGTSATSFWFSTYFDDAVDLLEDVAENNLITLTNSSTYVPNDGSEDATYHYPYYTYTKLDNLWTPDNNKNASATYAGTAGSLTIQDQRGGKYIVTTFTQSSGTLTLATNGSYQADNYTFTTFNGYGGTMNVNAGLTSTNANVGGSPSFTANVASTVTWTISGTLTASNTFNNTGAGTLNATSTTISGTSNHNAGTWNTNNGAGGTLTVGNGTGAGTLNINGGDVNSGGSGTGENNIGTTTAGTVNLLGGDWNTGAVTNVGTVGNAGKGTVTINDADSVWTATAEVSLATATNSEGEVWLKAGAWTATDETINVGLNGNGTVNQTGGTWTNEVTNVGVHNGSNGTINHSNGIHYDDNAFIGVGEATGAVATGTAIISGGTWTTNNDDGNNDDNVAIIGQNETGNGTVKVSDLGTWTIGDSTDDKDNLITADKGTGLLDVYTDTLGKGKVEVFGNHIIADETDSYGTDKVHGLDSTLDVHGSMTTGKNGEAQLKVYTQGKVTIDGDHTIAELANSYGSDQVDGNGSELIVTGNMIVGDAGQAGGYYVYYPKGTVGKENYPDGSAAYHGGGDYLDPTKNSNTGYDNQWLGSPNLELRPFDSGWAAIEADAPGLAITAGGKVTVAKSVDVAKTGGYAYILLDNIDNNTPSGGKSTWTITENLTMGTNDRANDNNDDAYMRIINGSLVDVGGYAVIANGAGTEVTVRVNGVDEAGTPNKATLDVKGNLTVAKGNTDGAKTEGNLYVYDQGQVIVGETSGANMTVADENNTLGRVHVDGGGSKIDVNGLLTIANKGQAGGVYDYSATPNKDNNPTNDNIADPSHAGGTWFDSANTLSDLKINNDINKNAPGLLITRGAQVFSNSGNVATAKDSYAYIVIDGQDAGAGDTKWVVDGSSNSGDGNLIIADKGTAYVRIFNGGLLEATSTDPDEGNIIIAKDSNGTDDDTTATVRVFGPGSEIKSSGDLTVAKGQYSDGQLYIYYGAAGTVGKNMIIADVAGSAAQVQVDGAGTTLTVTERLTVGKDGQAGDYYNENRYNPASATASTTYDAGYRIDPSELYHTADDDKNNLYDPNVASATPDKWWFDSPNLDLRNNQNYAGNAPGLAITDGAKVTSGSGVVASDDGSTGYVVIDNRYGFEKGEDRDKADRSTWHVVETDPPNAEKTDNGDLIIGREGKGFVRVLNGALLKVDGHTKLNSQINNTDTTTTTGFGSLYVFGNGGNKRATPNTATATDENHPDYVIPYADGNRTVWISGKATVLGDTGNQPGGEATLRIDNGAYGETNGIYAGYSAGSRGDVSVMGKGSELHIKKDNDLGVTPDYEYLIEDIEGSGGLSVSNHALLQLHDKSNITINGMSIISHNSLLHLDSDSIVNSREYCAKIVNARVEGIGTITAENGVTFLYDKTYATSLTDPVYSEYKDKISSIVTNPTSTQIDPGLYYGWNDTKEYYQRYGTLTFGDRLTLVGNVTTFIDVNAGWPVPLVNPNSPPGNNPEDATQMNDKIVVQRDENSTSNANIVAQLSGTLKIHARLTKYFTDDPSYNIVETVGDDESDVLVPGKIVSMFDRLEIVPWRFFESPHQEIVKYDANNNEALQISMKLKKNPFEEAGQTYNEKSTGSALDSIYALRRDDWLPVLRYFWYLEDPAFLNAYRSLSGEIRAHSLLLPLQNPWIYNQNRIGFRPCPNKSHNHGYNKPEYLDPCEMAELANKTNSCTSLFERMKRRWDKCKKDVHIWGDFIYETADYNTDGNAGTFDITRRGAAVGIDKPTHDHTQYYGFQFTFAESELHAHLAEAKAADFNFALYHHKKLHNVFEWKNYLGMGIQNYKTKRTIESGLADYEWVWDGGGTGPENGHYDYSTTPYNGQPRSSYRGYSFYANTELARPFILGTCSQYMIKPYTAIDVIGVWQNKASEYGNFQNAEFVKLDFLTANNIRTYARAGLLFERNGDHVNLHAGLSYNFLLGGRHYTNVDNKFQFDARSKKFNIRSTDTGNDFLNLNCGTEIYLGKKRNKTIMLNYQAVFGKNLTSHATQLGYQHKF
ncbi:MAG: hypothetical protein LBT09_06865 [Planctomycetaceae bacterium]|nr:hypothetical protein [Planctomycetaceae bacterium]